jgi:hypothetical protein
MTTKRLLLALTMITLSIVFINCKSNDDNDQLVGLVIPPPVELDLNSVLVAQGKETFRHDTFGDEALWTDVLELDKAILGEANGGFGTGLSPAAALGIGLKVDAEALPQNVVDGISDGTINLNDPMTTVALLSLDAVVGVKGGFDNDGNLISTGITCALCHSTVDNSFSSGIGSRLDGWANQDLNVGAILGFVNNAALADILNVDQATFNSVVNNWGPGTFAPILLLDGKVTKPNGDLATINIPPAYGLQGITYETYTGWGEVSYWNRFIGVLDMGGQGNFNDPRLNDSEKFPLAVERGVFNISVEEDLIDSKLEGLKEYQLSILAPKPDPSSYNEEAAIRGQQLFNGKAICSTCHIGAEFSDNLLHTPEEIGIDNFEAERSPTGKYRTPPLRGIYLKSTENGGVGYFHDGRFGTLNEVVDHWNNHFELELTESEQLDLVEFLKAL